jgi:MerR family transcriptional regulator, heat shock protein HspR
MLRSVHISLWTICGVRYRFHITTAIAHARDDTKFFWRGRQVPHSENDRGVYGISLVAELVETGVQNLRLYEARGLIAPARTGGGTRRYSANDVDRLRRIGELLGAGLNLAGIAMVIALETENATLRAGRGRAD